MDMPYLSHNDLREAIQGLSDERPEHCCGFVMKRLTGYRAPERGIHYDPTTNQPIAHLCYHGPHECQSFAEISWILVYAFAVGDINESQWRHLFPSRDMTGRGIPSFGSSRFSCCGFKCVQGDGRGEVSTIPGMIRPGFEFNPTTLSPETVPCTHDECDLDAPYKYALYKAFASDSLIDFGFELSRDECMKGMHK